jgi:hypothetical protein
MMMMQESHSSSLEYTAPRPVTFVAELGDRDEDTTLFPAACADAQC